MKRQCLAYYYGCRDNNVCLSLLKNSIKDLVYQNKDLHSKARLNSVGARTFQYFREFNFIDSFLQYLIWQGCIVTVNVGKEFSVACTEPVRCKCDKICKFLFSEHEIRVATVLFNYQIKDHTSNFLELRRDRKIVTDRLWTQRNDLALFKEICERTIAMSEFPVLMRAIGLK